MAGRLLNNSVLRPIDQSDVHVGPTHGAAPQSMVHDVGLASAQDGCVILLQSAIGGERGRVSWASDQFYAPDRRRLACRRGCAGDEHGNLATRDGLFRLHLTDAWACAGPMLR